MPVYTNVGGVRKELDEFYCNIDGVSKSVGKLYTNIGGTQKLLYEKTYVWAKYTALKGNAYKENTNTSNIGVSQEQTVLYGDSVSYNTYDITYPYTISGNIGTIKISDAISKVGSVSTGVNPLAGKYVAIYNYNASTGKVNRNEMYRATEVYQIATSGNCFMFYDLYIYRSIAYYPQTFIEYVSSSDPDAYPSAGGVADSSSSTGYYYYERQ